MSDQWEWHVSVSCTNHRNHRWTEGESIRFQFKKKKKMKTAKVEIFPTEKRAHNNDKNAQL